MIGHLSRDVVDGGPVRVGGGSWHAARALHVLRRGAIVCAKCAESDAERFRRQLAALDVPVTLATGGETTGFSMSYDAVGRRTMTVDAVGEPWSEDDLPARLLRRVEWLHVAPLLRGDVDAALLERLAHGRRLLLDGQGLVRRREPGPLSLDDDFDRGLLRHVTVLKLAEEEALVVAGGVDAGSLRALGVPEVLVTFGLLGSFVVTHDGAEHVQAHAVEGDPTGAGDAYAVSYAAARADGHGPVSAARRATAVVSSLLSGSPA